MFSFDDKDSLDSSIIRWNSKFPLDYVWRKKYNIPFGSQQHREMTHLNMFIDIREEELFRKAVEDSKKEADEKENILLGLEELNKKVIKVSQKEIDQDFDNLDISNFSSKDE